MNIAIIRKSKKIWQDNTAPWLDSDGSVSASIKQMGKDFKN